MWIVNASVYSRAELLDAIRRGAEFDYILNLHPQYGDALEIETHANVLYESIMMVDVNDRDFPGAPSKADIQRIISFANRIDTSCIEEVRLAVNCHAGLSRSPAAMYIILSIVLGHDYKRAASATVSVCNGILHPNKLMIELADELLCADGQMKLAAGVFYAKDIL